jgi:hypothetical protein
MKAPKRMMLNLPKVPGAPDTHGEGEGEGANQMVLTARLAREKDPKRKKTKTSQVSPSLSPFFSHTHTYILSILPPLIYLQAKRLLQRSLSAPQLGYEFMKKENTIWRFS